jgi:GxxExxY protein
MNRLDQPQVHEPQVHEPPAHLDRLAHAVIGAAIEVHRWLGPGYLEAVYEEALVLELGLRKLAVRRQVVVPIFYKDQLISESHLDLLIEDELVVELKSVESLARIHGAQLLSYLRATDLQLGLLMNFNVPILKEGIRRVINSRPG